LHFFLQNNWYDGPFDQMPDNYVYLGQIEVQKYLEACYPRAAFLASLTRQVFEIPPEFRPR